MAGKRPGEAAQPSHQDLECVHLLSDTAANTNSSVLIEGNLELSAIRHRIKAWLTREILKSVWFRFAYLNERAF